MSATHLETDVAVLGAGAAGLMCAITAAQRGRRVHVLERSNRAGKKILMSGGGRCNFTNQVVEAEDFISRNPHFARSALSRYTPWDFIALVDRHGIPWEERQRGQLFCERSSKDVLAMLLAECEAARVPIDTRVEFERLERIDGEGGARFRLYLDGPGRMRALDCESLVVATGALSIPTLGGSGAGYEIARQFGLEVTPTRAGLVPLVFSDETKALCTALAGVSTAVRVACNGQSFQDDLLFTHRGISGPAVLQISSYWFPGDALHVDLLPEEDAASALLAAKAESPQRELRTWLARHLPRSLAGLLASRYWPEMAERSLASITDDALRLVGSLLNDWTLRPAGSEGYRTAEVTVGGVDTGRISSKTMEVRDVPGLYFVGEVLDVTGHLGGYNFQWAWASGYGAGLAA